MKHLVWLVGFLACAPACSSLSSSSGSSDSATRSTDAFVPIQGDDGLLVWSAGCETWFVDAKDERLRDALQHTDARILELPEESGDASMPAKELQTAIEMLRSPMSVRARMVEPNDAHPFPVRAQAQFTSVSPERAGEMAAQLSQMLVASGAVATLGLNPTVHNMLTIPMGPQMSAYFGVAADVWPDTIVASVGEPELERAELGTLDLPRGVVPSFAFKLDVDQMTAAIALANPEAPASPFSGATGTVMQGGLGHGEDRMYGSLRTIGWVQSAQAAGLVPARGFTREEIALIPADATWCTLNRTPFAALAEDSAAMFAPLLAQQGLPPDTDPFELLRQVTAFDARADLIDFLGETWGAYTSDLTGGGGFMSLVAFVEITDEVGMAETLEWMETKIAELSGQMAKGYVGVQRRPSGAHEIATITFPGLPVPLEVSYALAHGWFFVALAPQALESALAHAREPGDDLFDNERFDELGGERAIGALSMSFFDTPRFVREGYGPTSMIGAAISNGWSSPAHPTRAPRAIVPNYKDLVDGAKGSLTIGRQVDGDLLLTLECDRSVWVNLSGMLGWIMPIVGFAAPVAAMIAAESEEQTAADFEYEVFGVGEMDGLEPEPPLEPDDDASVIEPNMPDEPESPDEPKQARDDDTQRTSEDSK